MLVKCGRCGAKLDLDAVSASAIQREILELYTSLGPTARLAREYLDLFRAASGELADRKHLRVLAEVVSIMREGRFRFYGREYAVTAPEVARAIQTTCDQEPHRLRDNAYLTKVLLSAVEKRDARAEAKREEQRRDPYRLGQENSTGQARGPATTGPTPSGREDSTLLPRACPEEGQPRGAATTAGDGRDEEAARAAIANFKEVYRRER